MKRIIKTTYILLAVIIVLISSLISCSRSNKDTVNIGMVTFPGYAPFYLAKEKKLFDNIDVNLHRIEAVGDLRAALKGGSIDMYIATFDIFQAIENIDPPGIGFLLVDESHGADGIVVTSDIKDISDLKGKTVGAEPGFPPYFILQYMLNKSNLTLGDIDFVDIASQDAGNAFVAKKLDVAGTYEPYLSKCVSLREGTRILISSAETEGLIVDIVFASEELLRENPLILKKVADGWFDAVKYWKENEEESMVIMAKAFGVTKEELQEIKSGVSWLTLEDNQMLFDKNNSNNVFTTFNLVGDILKENESSNFKVYAKDKLTSKIIDMY